MTSASNPPTADDEAGDSALPSNAIPSNPVTRARLRVEAEVPSARRGPGWDRHWRELEAYVESLAEWQGGQPPA